MTLYDRQFELLGSTAALRPPASSQARHQVSSCAPRPRPRPPPPPCCPATHGAGREQRGSGEQRERSVRRAGRSRVSRSTQANARRRLTLVLGPTAARQRACNTPLSLASLIVSPGLSRGQIAAAASSALTRRFVCAAPLPPLVPSLYRTCLSNPTRPPPPITQHHVESQEDAPAKTQHEASWSAQCRHAQAEQEAKHGGQCSSRSRSSSRKLHARTTRSSVDGRR